MKKEILGLLIILLFTSLSCQHNRLKTNEKELAKEINNQEQKKVEAEKILNEKQFADTLHEFPKGIRYKEDRSVDPLHPPIIIDIVGNLNNVKELKLSDVAAQINYIRMSPPPDSAFRRDVGFKYYLTPDYIIAINGFGIVQYNRNGQYINTIVKNEMTGMVVSPRGIMGMGGSTLIGAENPSVNSWVNNYGNKLYYLYCNEILGQEYLMEYDCSVMQLAPTIKYDPEKPNKVLGQGKITVDLNNGSPTPIISKKNSGSVRYLLHGLGLNWINGNTYSRSLKGKDMLAIFNKVGDTLSTFTQHEKLVNYTKSLQRGVDRGANYEFDGKSYFRNAFNDTISQVIPPNRLLPIYVFNLGSYKVTRQQGVDPGFDLSGKIIPQNWAETHVFIFLTFTKDNYDCISNRMNKKVKIYHALYSKIDNQLSIIKGDPLNYSSEILENDIDGGLPVWPSSSQIGKNGEILISMKGKDLKERVKSEKFRNSTAPETKKQELKKFADIVTETEDILMIIR